MSLSVDQKCRQKSTSPMIAVDFQIIGVRTGTDFVMQICTVYGALT